MPNRDKGRELAWPMKSRRKSAPATSSSARCGKRLRQCARQTVGAPLLTPHGADGGGVRQVGGATDLLQDGREEVRVAQDVSGSGGGGGRRGHGCEKFRGKTRIATCS
eukprot:scaffold81623_cov60-Phaeocystis_antarctica.AAC.2